jgi:hypothetical protein
MCLEVAKCAGIACLCVLATACGADDERVQAPPPATGVQTFTGCIGSTALPDRFVLSISKGRIATFGDPPGTFVPQPAPLPPGSPPPVQPPAGSVGLPGDGPDAVTKIVTFNLIGSGGMNMDAHIGHTVEILGDVQEIPEAMSAQNESDTLMRQLRVLSARHVSDECLGDP